MEYYKAFVEKYPRLGEWHEALQVEAISTGVVTLYTGQQFAFPDTRRLANGNASGAPSIKNYPVQGLAGGCVVPLALIHLQNEIVRKGITSKIINTVHDSIVLDVFPGEEEEVARMTYDAMTKVDKQFEEQYNVSWKVPLAVDLEIGKDWLNMQEYHLTNLS
jgi:DNA polymerase-1